MENKIRVIQFGLGPIGCAAARLVAKRAHLELVGAVDIDPAKIGKDVGDVIGAGAGAAVKPLSCPAILMPSSSDLYFTATDACRDASDLGIDCEVLESDFGHIAGGPGRLPAETGAIYRAAQSLLDRTAR